MNSAQKNLCVYLGEQLADYGFPEGHPFGPQRHNVFHEALTEKGLIEQSCVSKPVMATRADITRFHTPEYVDFVLERSKTGEGFLDFGDTPAFVGMYEAASAIVGSVLDAIDRIIKQNCTYAFIPIAGLHHATRNAAAGFCVFNDCGVAIETLLKVHGLKQVAYVDIDAHHGDGVYYSFENDPSVIFADVHQDGHTLYPGTGHRDETGIDKAQGTKLNIPVPPGANDQVFFEAWHAIEQHLNQYNPEFVLLQCGADSIAGDPITAMHYSSKAHAHAAERLRQYADSNCNGRLLAMGGGGYNLRNIADGWTAVVEQLL